MAGKAWFILQSKHALNSSNTSFQIWNLQMLQLFYLCYFITKHFMAVEIEWDVFFNRNAGFRAKDIVQ